MQRGLAFYLCQSLISLSLFVGFLLGNVYAEPTNTTIDDSNPAFSFVGQNWNSITPSSPCDWCATKLDPSLTYNSTWHNGASVGLAGTFQFEGSAVYLFGATVSTSTAEIAFTLDNGSPTNYDLNTVSQSVSHMYNVLLFSTSGLSNGKHTLSWTLTTVTGPAAFSSAAGHVALIDYAVVSSDVDSPAASVVGSPPSTGNNELSSSSNSAITSAATSIVSAEVPTSGSASSGTAQAGSKTSVNLSGSISPGTSISSFQAELGSVSTVISSASATVTISASAPPANSTDVASTGNGGDQSHVRLIATAAVGGTACAILILCIVLFVRRKRYLDRDQITKFDLIPKLEAGDEPNHTRSIYLPEKRLAYMRDIGSTNYSVVDTESSQPSSASTITGDTDSTDANATGQMQEMHQRIAMLEMMVQSQKDDRPISFSSESPPPY
ncbi:hypothetical protein D9757_009961 [Collybiopsis confluens]|uniref:Uncharacterized protein n=1 Tax=Collybiopsis confluens TaxID=2823264 RepID=A0A8H5H2B8_9AGAR|nr:hypothetical protein D9757_009961 [Collybiopsis confluens]